ncbi:MAG: DUF5522 domain-containing protein [Bacteroidetes bacterium]|nr:DUF5522 domain-containing protein [Bacteroidota bacterium]
MKYQNPSRSPLEPEDFYLNERGLMVFTEAYHLKRGYCCKSSCKHCPYSDSHP